MLTNSTNPVILQLAKLHPGISRTMLHHYLSTGKYKYISSLPQEYTDLIVAFRLDWSVDHFLARMEVFTGTLPTASGLHHIVFAEGLTRGKLIAMDQAAQLTLSFRSAAKEFGLPSYVIVSLKS